MIKDKNLLFGFIHMSEYYAVIWLFLRNIYTFMMFFLLSYDENYGGNKSDNND